MSLTDAEHCIFIQPSVIYLNNEDTLLKFRT